MLTKLVYYERGWWYFEIAETDSQGGPLVSLFRRRVSSSEEADRIGSEALAITKERYGVGGPSRDDAISLNQGAL